MKTILLVVAMTNMFGDTSYSEIIHNDMTACLQSMDNYLTMFDTIKDLEMDVGIYSEQVLRLDALACTEV